MEKKFKKLKNVYKNKSIRLVELPSYAAGILFMDKVGRRPTLSGGLLLSGVSCLVTGFIPPGVH